ncbi:NAD(P)-dependent dehydrogenase (short-subunit alcohol dehydrogenase family) [Sagittula marina]|uniref:NAD(P)-dependent dehydrogenase (Short-subunit alcohol dehydrogenase family) n=1 Tax=Sagittula marina TaxID=943940 RepID=A0A7W6GTQ8_9RHOB|nr:SDR family NAD(P)-dependent oxidoreductase [Sagittula marina]MBB3987365.1 NAD(P)-dependent dehydrogenase (short-subunit alcohol dehydrogenase family) [Sagittula marina]
MDLNGQVAVVTGAGRGIGRSMAQHLAQAGASVVVNDLDADPAQHVVDEITQAGGKAVAVAAEIGTEGAAEACIAAALDSFGRLDVLVANAGVLRDSVLWKTEDEAFDLVIRTHLRGTFQCGRAAARHFREAGHGGALVLVGSPAGQLGNFGQTAYAAAKAGIAGMTRTWAAELQRAEVAVNAIIPTALTRMTETIPPLAPYVQAMERGEPLPEKLRADLGIGLPEDIAPLVVYLASQAGRATTGQCIGIGGDRLAFWSHPSEHRVQTRSGGWTPDSIAEAWPDLTRDALQPFGITMDL